MKDYRFSSAALTELKQVTLDYEEKENGLGAIFLDEVDATVARILTNPNAWHPLSPRTRRCRGSGISEKSTACGSTETLSPTRVIGSR
jgi:hypothetical protein